MKTSREFSTFKYWRREDSLQGHWFIRYIVCPRRCVFIHSVVHNDHKINVKSTVKFGTHLKIRSKQPSYRLNWTSWFLFSVKLSRTGGNSSNSMAFCTDDCVISISSWWLKGRSGMQGSIGMTPIASQSRWISSGGDGGLGISSSTGRCLWNLGSGLLFSWWLISVQVSETGSEAAKRILNSWSKESTTGPFRTVIICRCRWASVHVRLSVETTCYSICGNERTKPKWIIYL